MSSPIKRLENPHCAHAVTLKDAAKVEVWCRVSADVDEKKDLTAGAAGGVAQVLIGELFDFDSWLFNLIDRELTIRQDSLSVCLLADSAWLNEWPF